MELPDFEQYAAELKKLEDEPPAAIELPPLAAIALITLSLPTYMIVNE